MDRLFTLFEQQSVTYQALGLSANDPLLDALDRLNQKAGCELVRLERSGLRATQYVGVLQVGGYQIQILPKIDCDPAADTNSVAGSDAHSKAATSAAQNFMYLLTHVNNLKLHNQTLSSLRSCRTTWLELLTRLFAIELLTQLQQGFHQDYIQREDPLPFIRGRWNIARQFVRQPNLFQGLDVTYDDYLPDTLLNRIFRLTVDRLLHISHDTYNRRLLSDLECCLQPVQLIPHIDLSELDHVVFNRLNERYYPAFQLARLLFSGQSVRLLAGNQRAYAIIFNMDRLFELFVVSLLQNHARRILPEPLHGLPITFQGGQIQKHLILPPYPGEACIFHLKPDILLGLPSNPLVIIDTKNKTLPLNRAYRAVAESDAYQMLVYATQFHCPNVVLLYPRTLGAVESTVVLTVTGSPIRFYIASIDLHQPLERLDRLIYELSQVIDVALKHMIPTSEVVWQG